MDRTVDIALAERLARVQESIDAAARRAGRDPGDVTLIAVSKTMDARAVFDAVRLGARFLGENRVQEAEAKIAEVASLAAAENVSLPHWHLIGHLQTNKAGSAARLFSMIESVDSIHLAATLDRQARNIGDVIDVLLEVNVGGEVTKFGFAPDQVDGAFAEISLLPSVRVVGLMTVAPPVENAEDVRPIFRQLRQIRDSLVSRFPESALPHLSMGMTGDYPIAIEEGATIVRVGRAIFGERPVGAP